MRPSANDPASLARAYLGGLAHVHTKLSNHPGHFESDQSITSFVNGLAEHGLVGRPEAPFKYIMINEHASNPARPRRLGKLSLRARALLRSRWENRSLGVPIMHGFEASLMADGDTDLTPWLAEHCELVILSCHHLPKAYEAEPLRIGELFDLACHKVDIDVLGHPLRGLERIGGFDWGHVFETAAATGTAVEVNLNVFPSSAAEPERYRLWERWLEELDISGAAVFIGSDLHNKWQFDQFIRYYEGLSDMARPNPLRDCLVALDAAGITPDRVVNAEYATFKAWLGLSKEQRLA